MKEFPEIRNEFFITLMQFLHRPIGGNHAFYSWIGFLPELQGFSFKHHDLVGHFQVQQQVLQFLMITARIGHDIGGDIGKAQPFQFFFQNQFIFQFH